MFLLDLGLPWREYCGIPAATLWGAFKLERRAGIEPANTGFADLRVSRFATGAFQAVAGKLSPAIGRIND